MSTYLEALRRIKGGEIVSLKDGICYNLEELVAEVPRRFYRDMVDWPEGTQCMAYPVPAPDSYRPEMPRGEVSEGYYWKRHDQLDMWVGDYGEARRRLLDYLIECEEARYGEES